MPRSSRTSANTGIFITLMTSLIVHSSPARRASSRPRVQLFLAHQADDGTHRTHIAALQHHIDAFRHIDHAGRAHDVTQRLHTLGGNRRIGGAGQIARAGRDFGHTDLGGCFRHLQIFGAFGRFSRAPHCGRCPGDFHLLATFGQLRLTHRHTLRTCHWECLLLGMGLMLLLTVTAGSLACQIVAFF